MMHPEQCDRNWQELWNRAREGDSEAFGTLWQEYLMPKVSAYARRRLYNIAPQLEEDVKDIVQEIGARLYKGYREIPIQHLEEVERFVQKMTQNACGMYHRTQTYVRFMLTEQTFNQLKLAQISPEIIDALAHIQQSYPVARENFLKQVAAALRDKLTDRLKQLILQYSRYEYERQEDCADETLDARLAQNTTHNDIEQREIYHIILQEIQDIPNKDEREVFTARILQDTPYREISQTTGKPVPTLHAQCEKYARRLRQHPTLRMYFQERC